MILIQEPQLSSEDACHYLPNRCWQFEYFFALDLDDSELDELLEKGWRKFGAYFFRPKCGDCEECIPIRVPVNLFELSKSQKRALKKCAHVSVKFRDLEYRDDIYEIYRDHSINRFSTHTEKEDFIASFYTQSCSSLQSEYYIDSKLVAIGFLDRSLHGLSSVYFAYHTSQEKLGLGTYSALKEIEYAQKMGLSYYYLGYYIDDNASMSYKNRFKPNEWFEWRDGTWKAELK